MPIHRLASWLMLAAWVAILAGCHNKESAFGGPDEYLRPPAGLAFSIPTGEMTAFHPLDGRVIGRYVLEHWPVSAAAINTQRTRLFVVSGSTSRFGILDLPNLQPHFSGQLAGVPVDLQVSSDGSRAYIITQNANLWTFDGTTGDVDTVESGRNPRRLMLRPPSRTELWVACTGDSTVRVVRVAHPRLADTLRFGRPPTALAFSPDGHLAYVALGTGQQGTVRRVNALTYEIVDDREAGSGPFELAISGSGQFLAAADSTAARTRIWDLNTSEQWDIPTGAPATKVRYSRSANAFFVGVRSTSRVLKVDLTSGTPALTGVYPMLAQLSELVFLE